MKVTLIAGARPNFMKIAPIIHEIKRVAKNGNHIDYRLIHTGQHYDLSMSQKFFEELDIPEPDQNLGAGGGTQAEQTGAIMIGFEKELSEHRPDLVIVVGDVTSTLACSIVAKKAKIAVAHVEAGIRSGDLTMPEEINRMVTDSISDYFFTTSGQANYNLRALGVKEDKIFFVGNTMIDTLVKNLDRLRQPIFFSDFQLQKGKYFVLTMHRPSNVDEINSLLESLNSIVESADGNLVVFPIHPRTEKILAEASFENPILKMVEPMGYLEFNYLVRNALGVITDSGGITEETTYLGVPCITLRENTERPETITQGTNVLAGISLDSIGVYMRKIIAGDWKKGSIPELWDGETSKRIVKTLLKLNSRPLKKF